MTLLLSSVIVAAAGAILWFGEAMTVQKIVGIGMLVVGIVLLRPT